jgi:serine phosphatase RsbU (regulator of sigma subunit)
MTMLVSACFRRVIAEEGHSSPGRILEALHAHVRSALARESGELAVDDGLDAACVFLEHGSGVVRFASARLLLLIAGDEGVQEIKGDRTSIGYPSLPESVSVVEQIVPIRPGQLLYLFTDGFTDQVGGDRACLFGRRRLVQTIDTLRRLAAGRTDRAAA